MRTADKYPAFKDGWIVIDDRNAPSLRHAIGCRIYKTPRAAIAKSARAVRGLAIRDAIHLRVVPVDGESRDPSGERVFATDYIDAEGVTVRPDGTIRLNGGAR